MRKVSYIGGSSIEGPGASFWTRSREDAPKETDPELEAIMAEHDGLRALGIRPMDKLKEKNMKKRRLKKVGLKSPTRAT